MIERHHNHGSINTMMLLAYLLASRLKTSLLGVLSVSQSSDSMTTIFLFVRQPLILMRLLPNECLIFRIIINQIKRSL